MLTKTHSALQDKRKEVVECEAKLEKLEAEMGATLDEKQRLEVVLNEYRGIFSMKSFLIQFNSIHT